MRRVLSVKGVTGDCVDIAATYSSRLETARAGSGEDNSATTDGNDTSNSDGTGPADAGINDTSGSGANSSGGTRNGWRDQQQRWDRRLLGFRSRRLSPAGSDQSAAASTSSARASSANGSPLITIRCCAPASR